LRLVTFAPRPHGPRHTGLLRGAGHVIDLTRIGGNPPFDPADMISLIAAGDAALAWLRDTASKADAVVPLDKVALLAPILVRARTCFCVGWNYVEHFDEGKKARPHVQEMPRTRHFSPKHRPR